MTDRTGDTPDSPRPPDASLEASLGAWLRDEVGVDRPRRLVRVDDAGILVSKFEPGFSARLHALLDLVPELFDEAAVVAAYARIAAEAPPDASRVAAWHEALHGLLAAAGKRHAIPDERLAEVRAGIDSVRAVLDSVLWTDPKVGDDDYAPHPAERSAYLDGLDGLADGRDRFTRTYGVFEGRLVRNHCPGAPFARLMLAHGWRACTGIAPPVPSP